jgi:cobalt-zinc-cadmium efflux system membrane fusion protein
MKRPVLISIGVVVFVFGVTLWPLLRGMGKSDSVPDADPAATRDHVELSEEKFAAAKITVTNAAQRQLRSQRVVPGHVKYNETRHVELKSPFDGLIRQIDVKVGDRVTEGQVLAIVDSPDLGEKRADVLLRESDLQLAKVEYIWWHSIQSNLDELLARLKRPQDVSQLEKEFADKPLGDYRQKILGSYEQMRLAQKTKARLDGANAGDIPETDRNRMEAARNQATAKYLGDCEQATKDVAQQELMAKSSLKDAERRLAVARQRLGLLVGQSQDSLSVVDEATLSMWPVKAPFTGTVEEIKLAPKERILTAQGLFQLADTSRLWIEADIRERDWAALSVTKSQAVSVQTPALPGKTLEATVAFVGRTVSPETRAVPLIADIDNANGLLRPGMFVRVLIPEGEPRECLTVPQSAIATNDGRTFVFLETGPLQYHPRDVTMGIAVEPWVEITSGLNSGEPVVTSGVAILKAELLLEAEE